MKYSDMQNDAPAPKNFQESMAPCRGCGGSTRAATLSHYGGRCISCHESFTQVPVPAPQMAKNYEGPKAWAWRIRAREMALDRLTPAQKTMWREALRGELRDEKVDDE